MDCQGITSTSSGGGLSLPGRVESLVPRPLRIMDQEGMKFGLRFEGQVPQCHPREKVKRLVIRVVIGRVRQEDLGRLEVTDDRRQILQDIIAPVFRAGR